MIAKMKLIPIKTRTQILSIAILGKLPLNQSINQLLHVRNLHEQQVNKTTRLSYQMKKKP